MIDHTKVCLGKRFYVHDPRDFHLSTYLPELPKVPTTGDWGKAVKNWGMDANDRLGDCTCAGVDHTLKVWIDNHGGKYKSTDADVIAMYSAVGGYDPRHPETDSGANLIDCLKYWQKTGFLGHKIDAYVKVDATNLSRVRAALYLFGALYSGVGLPLTAQGQDIWTVTNPNGSSGQPYSWGGHCVVLTAWDQKGFTCATWGTTQKMDNAFLGTYFDELWAIVSLDWFTAQHLTPAGFKYGQLMADLKAVQK